MNREAQALLLTGVPGVGKTTIVRALAATLSEKRIRGFVTDEIRRVGRRVGFELSTFTGHKVVLAHVDLGFRQRVGRYGVDVAQLDEIAEKALALDNATDVYLVDEIGKMSFPDEHCDSGVCGGDGEVFVRVLIKVSGSNRKRSISSE